ncbi:hypothetical protein ACP275_09G133000 [Erythranthe tilingii]
MEEPEPNTPSDHILGWIGESISYFPTFFDDPYDTGDFSGDSWWVQPQDLDQELIGSSSNSFNAAMPTTTAAAPTPTESIVSDQSSIPLDSTKKRKLPDNSSPKVSRKNTNRLEDSAAGVVEPPARRPVANRRVNNRSAGNSSNGNNKEGRWAEQLLSPCAAAITARNPSRVQHFLYVLHDLASLNGDANHRLAFHGLRALTHHLSSSSGGSGFSTSNTFAASNPKFFRDSLIRFNDINPWFRIPNSVANSSILQILAEQKHPTNTLHILDIGVSHGLQWPTLLEELTRRTGGPPPLVRLTTVDPPTGNRNTTAAPFAHGPQDYDFSSKLLGYAKDININLQIDKMENFHLQNLNPQTIKSFSSSEEETLIICAQFRLHNLNHTSPDERSEFLKLLRGLNPKGLILSENNADCSCNNCGDFATGFSRRMENLWRFFDSTSIAYKGRESDERKMMEAEAAKMLISVGEMSEKKEKWCERMKSAGFRRELFGEETVDGAKALLRKYDSNWEIRVDDKDGCVGLFWKGETVSFCSLWKVIGLGVEDCLV